VSAFRRTSEVRLKAGRYIGPAKAGHYNLLKIALAPR
jgi:hypothetical protein